MHYLNKISHCFLKIHCFAIKTRMSTRKQAQSCRDKYVMMDEWIYTQDKMD